jgi:O-antigen/teichoic acid export membrane protein
MVLSVAELGFSTAVSYALYRPLSESDTLQIAKLMKLYKKIYRVVFFVVAGAGVVSLLFLNFIVKDVPDIKESIHVVFLFFVFKTAVSYLFVYKATLLDANQESHVVSMIGTVSCVVATILETVVITVFKSYMGYLFIMVIMVVVQNVVLSVVADRRYPFLKQTCCDEITASEKKNLFKNVRALAIYKVSAALQKSVDSIVISAMLGTGLVGLLSCYKMISGNTDILFGQVFESAKAGVGNVAASESGEKQYEVFKKMCFLAFMIGNFIAVSLVVLSNPFVELWLGSEYLMGMSIVMMLAADAYIITMVRPYEAFRNANALFVQGKYRPAIMIVINIVLSIAFAMKMGVFGVLFATVLSRLLTHVWYDPWLVYRKVFHKPFSEYIKVKLKYVFVVTVNCIGVYSLCSYIKFDSLWVSFFVKALCCAIVPNMVVLILFFRNQEFRSLTKSFKAIIKK